MTEKTSREQSITIQVMRLAKPIPSQPISSFCGPSDVDFLNSGNQLIDLPSGQYPIVPHVTSDVFLGECFTFYVAIINTTLFKCEQINMKVDIQTQLQRISIAETSFSNVSLVHKQQVGQIFSHEINELGQHILVCSVSYIGGNEEKLNLRKFFKFSVNKPVDLLNQTFYELNDKTTFYEFQIKNLTPNPIFIEFLTFEECGNNLPYNCELTGFPSLNTDSEPLGLQNIHQYIFRLTHNEQCDAENWRKILNFGRLKIVWRSTTGDNGRTFFNTIERSQFICRDLRLTVDRAPKKAKVNGMLTVVCNLRNWSDRPLDLLLNFDQNVGPIIHCSVSGQRLPTILPGHNIQISFEILPYVKGLQSISGVFLTDLLLKRTFEFNNIFDIFIE